MIEKILAQASTCDFDFRRHAHPQDPLAHLFEEWVPYYRLKAAIAHAIQPRTILEIGVRYGYSAHAFLHGSPNAEYLGIDNDSGTYGGSSGALDWARESLSSHRTTLQQGNTQCMDAFPGNTYDLIHVDGQQDGVSTYRDLELALAQGRWILVDGYFWTEPNFRESNEFLLRHKDVVEYALVIPGYAGELMIKTRPNYLKSQTLLRKGPSTSISSEALVACYDQNYYLNDCGGHESYRRNGPERIEDPRLLSILALLSLKEGGRLLDLGCGRGEITFQAARHGYRATGLDYSEESIAIAEKKLEASPELHDRLEFLKGNAANLEFEDKCDAVIASDLIEHLPSAEVEACYEQVSRILAKDGIFIVHTFPNAWYYRYDYPRRRRQAATLGAFLPAEPRSRFERLMHVNEQNPRILLKQLKQRFPHVLLWFGAPDDPAGSLKGSTSPNRIAAYRDLFAIASNTTIDQDAVCRILICHRFTPDAIHGNLQLRILNAPVHADQGQVFSFRIEIHNSTNASISSLHPHPINVSYHWREPSTREYVLYNGRRTQLQLPIGSGQTAELDALCAAPDQTGEFELVCTLVQEHHAWFDQPDFGVEATVRIRVDQNPTAYHE